MRQLPAAGNVPSIPVCTILAGRHGPCMLDTHSIARQLAGAGLTGNQMDAVRQAAERGATAIDVSALASKTDLSGLEARICRAMLMQTAVTVGLLGLVLGALRWLG